MVFNNFLSTKLQSIKIDDSEIGLRQFGNGQHVIFIHGFPTHGYTWRKILPHISEKYKCHVLDLPGLGESNWTNETNLYSQAQANRIIKLINALQIEKCSIVSHNSGATIARIITIDKPSLVDKLVLINTEIPNHRPPWIPLYQKIGLLPLVPNIIRLALKQSWFVKSSMGFREAYSNKKMLENSENLWPYIQPIISTKKRLIGAFKYLKGIDWEIIDDFKKNHQKIKAKTLLIWGEDDKTFPVKLAENMVSQFKGNCELVKIKSASLLPHEEKNEEVASIILNFLKDNTLNS